MDFVSDEGSAFRFFSQAESAEYRYPRTGRLYRIQEETAEHARFGHTGMADTVPPAHRVGFL